MICLTEYSRTKALQSKNFPAALLPLLLQAAARSTKGRCLAIAPEPRYHRPGYRRIIYFQRPTEQFSVYDKQEFWLPEHLVVPLVNALSTPAKLKAFEAYRQPATTRDFLVCAHAELDICCGRFSRPIYERLNTYAQKDTVRIWRTSHISSHRLAPTLIDFPEGRYWGHLEPDTSHHLAQRNRSVTDLRSYYRGWAGLPPLAQIVEREIFMERGWDWCTYRQSGWVSAIDEARSQVQIDFTSPDGETGCYRATVTVNGTVMTLHNSGKGDFSPVKQYKISNLEQL
ncbi:sucrase ferredoxin [Adonisia turfae]|uniref:Sucrase ferredoxin n=1 Tax=Adonisia turfae CCMR0081 TaxID=2292702 RepID=A0A6M0RSQ0_9CYAN|nr:sucrase ferredoxin [Adonisia turfae CCMR0081]